MNDDDIENMRKLDEIRKFIQDAQNVQINRRKLYLLIR